MWWRDFLQLMVKQVCGFEFAEDVVNVILELLIESVVGEARPLRL